MSYGITFGCLIIADSSLSNDSDAFSWRV